MTLLRALLALAALAGSYSVLSIACAQAQTETISPPPPNSDSKTAPGLSYTPAQMLKRLVQLAEGPVPTRAELEKEFGFEFKLRSTDKGGSDYKGQAAYPFAPIFEANRSNFSYYDFSSGPSIAIRFEGYGVVNSRPKYCIRTDFFLKEISPKWQRHTVPHGHFPTDVFYTATVQGISRRLDFSPNYLQGDGCMYFFSIHYLTEQLNQGEQK